MDGPVKLLSLLLVLFNIRIVRSFGTFEDTRNEGSPCYGTLEDGTEDLNKPLRCMPPFINVISNAPVTVDPEEMTCGIRSPIKFCLQTGGFYRECQICDAYQTGLSHNTSYLTDLTTDQNQTSWQSVTLNEGVHMTLVNLTVNLKKAYDITFVRLKFASPRPESFAIYKKFRYNAAEEDPNPDEGWIPWQYYSASCRDTYDVHDVLDKSNLTYAEEADDMETFDYKKLREDRALCTSEFSDISPLTGGNVAFATLDDRPGAYNFDHNRELQNWVSATDIRISLRSLNTFGDEVYGDPKVLQSYYYAISQFSVGGRCKCNGHSNVCIPSDSEDPTSRNICLCKHGTTGDNCETCLPDHWDRRWQRATTQSANPCLPCECNNWSTKCRFNEELYMDTGRGGECLECGGNRAGPHCEVCQENHFISPVKDAYDRQPCLPCDCDPRGSTDLQCSIDGKCKCKPGVTGEKCDMCEANYWNFPTDAAGQGCDGCECMVEGSAGNRPSCDQATGKCVCKDNVEGQRCQRCKSGHFYIDLDNEFGCTPCFCYLHTALCDMAGGYTRTYLVSDFSRGTDEWSVKEDGKQGLSSAAFDPFKKFIKLQSVEQSSFFVAPPRFIGDQRKSYNQELRFRLKIGVDDIGPRASADDLIIEAGGAKHTSISVPITAQNNPLPSKEMQEYTFKLHENPEFGWTPSLRPKDFMAILSNITSIKIKGSYVPNGKGYFDEFVLETAEYGGSGKPATWVEKCECPKGYRGQFCEKCQLGFYHENNGGPFARCIPCNCNGHSDYCNEESGVCNCGHNTGGDNCEVCADGFYGSAINGTPDDCKECPCPMVETEDGSRRVGRCYEVEGDAESPLCTECPTGRTGKRCELCIDGYFGDPDGKHGERRECRKCDCSRNIDDNAIGNCDRVTGECLRCIDDTAGFRCEKCRSGFFGDALAPKTIGEKNCQACQCYPPGTFHSADNQLPECNSITGKCSCKANVVGHDCDKCKDGFWNLDSGNGCEACNCDPIGSLNATCNDATGQCFCREGIHGLRCDQLMPLHYGFSVDGAKPCDCDPSGSLSDQCDEETGQCQCRDKVEGRRCDTCMENTKTKVGSQNEKICEPCDDCYNLVQNAANEHRQGLNELETLLRHIAESPEPVGQDFMVQLKKLRVRITNMLVDTKLSVNTEDGASLRDRLEDLYLRLDEVQAVVSKANDQLDQAQLQGRDASDNVQRAEDVINRARESLRAAKNLMDIDGREALRRAQEKARKFGEGNAQMSSLASTARKLAEEQFESASEIESIAKQANELSTDAYKHARDALEEQSDTANQIQQLQAQLRDMSTKLSQVQGASQETLKMATDAYVKAITISQSVAKLEVPDVETSKLSDQSRRVSKDAERIKEDAQRLMTENDELLRKAMVQRYELNDLFIEAETQQANLERQLSDMKNNRDAALNAVNTGNTVLEEARKTLEILQDFDKRVEENRGAAEGALDKISNIENTLRLAGDDTKAADEALHETDNDSVTAYEIAIESKNTAEEASKNAKTIVEESRKVAVKAENLKNDATSLKAKSDETEARVQDKDQASSVDSSTAADALREANKAQSSSKEATVKVNQAKMELEEISQILATIDNPDSAILDDLERRLDAAERKYEEADLEAKLKQLEESKQRQILKASSLQGELSKLEVEAATIKDITQTLPDFCPINSDHCLEC